jgi:signal transduction histidine kinase
MCDISWDGEEAQIIIITEDLATQRINDLNEQARYKDKLLGSVSHNLRTPLNGVIGILQMTLEAVTDESV